MVAWKFNAGQISGTPSYLIGNLNQLRSLLAEMTRFPGLTDLVNGIREQSWILSRVEDSLTVARDEIGTITTVFHRLRTSLSELRGILNAALPDPTEDAIRIKLPDDADYHGVISDLSKIFKILEQALLDPSTDDPEMVPKIRLDGWENGSFWIQVSLGSAYLVSLVGSIAWLLRLYAANGLRGQLW